MTGEIEDKANLIRKAFLLGFEQSAEGYNNEYPFYGAPEGCEDWCAKREDAVKQLFEADQEANEVAVLDGLLAASEWFEERDPEAADLAARLYQRAGALMSTP